MCKHRLLHFVRNDGELLPTDANVIANRRDVVTNRPHEIYFYA